MQGDRFPLYGRTIVMTDAPNGNDVEMNFGPGTEGCMTVKCFASHQSGKTYVIAPDDPVEIDDRDLEAFVGVFGFKFAETRQ